MPGLLEYDMGGGVCAFTAGRDVPLPCAVVQPHQTHSTVVAHVDRPGLTREDLEGVDALVTDLPGVAIGVRTADCIPVLLYDPVHRAIGAALHEFFLVNKFAELNNLRESVFCHMSIIAFMFLPQEIPSRRAE